LTAAAAENKFFSCSIFGKCWTQNTLAEEKREGKTASCLILGWLVTENLAAA